MNTYISNLINFLLPTIRVFNVTLSIVNDKTEYIDLYIRTQKDFILYRED